LSQTSYPHHNPFPGLEKFLAQLTKLDQGFTVEEKKVDVEPVKVGFGGQLMSIELIGGVWFSVWPIEKTAWKILSVPREKI